MSARVAGLDLSMTATGIAWADGTTYTVKPTQAGDGRLLDILGDIAKVCFDVDLVVIEDLPANAKSAGITGMVHGAVRAALLRSFVPYALVTPASLKKYATGRGNAGKPEMAVAAYKRLGREPGDDNQVDALWLRAMGLEHLGEPAAELPAAQRAALDAVKWPEVTTFDPAARRPTTPRGAAPRPAKPLGVPMTHTRVHTRITFANPYLACDRCKQPVPAWHNPDRCGCGQAGWQNLPCGHQAGVTGTCPSWSPVDGCRCLTQLGHVPHAPTGIDDVPLPGLDTNGGN